MNKHTAMVARTFIVLIYFSTMHASVLAAELWAGIGKLEITDRDAGPVNDPSYVKALVLRSEQTVAAIITVDAVAIGEIGRIGNEYLGNVRATLKEELGIEPRHVIVNASHCHSIVRADTDALTINAVKSAFGNMVPVRIGVGRRQESTISENRRLKMKDGSEIDMRRAYSMPRDEDVASVGPIDPDVGILRIDRMIGKPLAVVYNFACHPIVGAPSGGNTADFPGYASSILEDAFDNDAMAFFIQGCAGDINPIRYKSVAELHDSAPLGHRLGHSVLKEFRNIRTTANEELRISNRVISLPRGVDLEKRIAAIQSEQSQLVQSLKPTDINFKTFLPLLIQHKLSPEFPSYYAQGYLHEESLGQDSLKKLDSVNRANIDAYLTNIDVMERLTRLNVNLALLKKHHQTTQAAGDKPLDVELVGIRIGDFHLVTFPGEVTVDIGLGIKRRSPATNTFVAGYTNGYIYYTPTANQRRNTGYAQEDCDCLVAPEWQELFEQEAMETLSELSR
jgi:hypothetical protein